jgi:hypothetical protein
MRIICHGIGILNEKKKNISWKINLVYLKKVKINLNLYRVQIEIKVILILFQAFFYGKLY